MLTNPYTASYAPSTFEQISPEDKANLAARYQNTGGQQAFQNQMNTQAGQLNQQAAQIGQSGQGISSVNPLAMAMALRQGNSNVQLPTTNTPQMTGVAGMGDSMGTGLTQNSFNSGIGFNPSAQAGGYGIKY